MKQLDLAKLVGMTPSAVSANLRSNHTMTENFVRNLGFAVPRFSDAFVQYFEIKSGMAASDSTKGAVGQRKERAERIKLIRQTEKEVLAAVRGLFDELTKIVESD